MNIKDKIGQRLMVNFMRTELTPEIADFLVENRVGGLIHFGYNISSLSQITELNRDLQDLAARHGLPTFLIAIDEEGGRVSRMPADGQNLIAPSPMAQAAAGADGPAICAGVIARNLRRLGFNVDFAPLADVNNNPSNPVIASRSYGSQPANVSRAVVAAVEAFLANGVAPCVKHFPGHGDTNIDSHLGLPVIEHGRKRLDEVELEPFRAAFAAGVPALMTAHILYPELEPSGVPATLSSFFLQHLLRDKLNFAGLVFSDALNMRAIADRYSIPEACFMTLQAGADIALPLGSLDVQRKCVELLLERADHLELDKSLERIRLFKERFCLPPTPADPAAIAADVALIEGVTRRSITLLPFDTEQELKLPLSPDELCPVVLDFELPMGSMVEEGRQPGPILSKELAAHWPGVRYLPLPGLAAEEKEAEALAAASEASLLIIVTRNAHRLPVQAQLVQKLLAIQPRTVAIAVRDPYDLKFFDNAALRLTTYGDPPASIRGLVAVLFGLSTPTGKLPVTLD